jgi:hypothetical protein
MNVAYLIGALFLAAVHLLGRHLDLRRFHHRRRWLSAAAGVSVAYVFVDMLPLMNEKQRLFVEAAQGLRLPAPEFRVHLAALLGFVVFYGLEHLVGARKLAPAPPGEADQEQPTGLRHLLHVGGFGLYNVMMGYLLIEWSTQPVGLALYCGALGLHFLVTDDGLRRDYGASYDRGGRWAMAACIIAGVLVAALTPVSIGALTLVVGFVAGGVVINSLKDELPSPDGGRFLPFLMGSALYAALIIVASKLAAG